MNLIIPPPIVGAMTALIMWLLYFFFPEANVIPDLFTVAAYLLVAAGIVVEIVCVARFFNVGTTINPFTPERSRTLVTNGLFQFSRNPMYAGMFAVLLGAGLWLGNLFSLVPLIGFVWYITEFQIKPEEKILQGTFGERYTAYRKRVRRWI